MLIEDLHCFVEATERKAIRMILDDFMASRIDTRQAFKETIRVRSATDRMRKRISLLKLKEKM